MFRSLPVLAVVLVGWTDCTVVKIDTPDTADGCDYVTAACPATGRAYWSTCDGGGWDWIRQCNDDGCAPVAHGEQRYAGTDSADGWVDPWAECGSSYDTIEGVICCVQ